MVLRRTWTLAIAGLMAAPLALAQQPGQVAHRPIASPYGGSTTASTEVMPTTTVASPAMVPMAVQEPGMLMAVPSAPMGGQRLVPVQQQYAAPGQLMVPAGQYQPMPGTMMVPAGQYQPMPGPTGGQPGYYTAGPGTPVTSPGQYIGASSGPVMTSGSSCGPNGCGQPACNAGCEPTCNLGCEKPCPCGPAGMIWLIPEYIAWATKGANIPPLVTTAPPGLPRGTAGVLGQPGTSTLYGGTNDNDDLRSGFRFRAGTWFDCCQTRGIEASIFYLGQADNGQTFSSSGTPTLARPFTNAVTGLSDAEITALIVPAVAGAAGGSVATGSIDIHNTTDLWGGDINYRHNLHCSCDYRLDFLAGYRYLRLYDNLRINENVTSTDPTSNVPVNTNFALTDIFTAENNFHGGQVGLAAETRRGNWYFGATGKVALGGTREHVTINGTTITTVPGAAAPVSSTGALLAQRSNIGSYDRTEFAVVPEVFANLGYQFTPHLRGFVGYNFLYISRVARAAEQIDTNLNLTQLNPGGLMGPARPAFTFKSTDFWAQGISGGIEFRY